MTKSQSKSGSRKSKRALVNLQQKPPRSASSNGGGFAKVEDVNRAFQQLSDNQQRLGEVVNKTNQGMIQAFTMQDAHLHVQRRIMNDFAVDIIGDKEGTLYLADSGVIDWDKYFNEYEGMRCAVMLVEWIKRITAPAAVDASQIVQPTDGGVEAVFGGDL